jgi:hypothetical protein
VFYFTFVIKKALENVKKHADDMPADPKIIHITMI